MKYISKGDTLEAEHADVITKKLEWKGIRRHPDTNQAMTLYECSRNSSVKIIKVYAGEILECTEKYHRELGDLLEADCISVYSSSKRKLNQQLLGGYTGRHKAQSIDLRERSISTIKYPLENLVKCIEEKSNLLENNKQIGKNDC